MTTLYFAPVQGHTDAAYRHFHNETYDTGCIFTTPFIRKEKEGFRPKDIKDVTTPLNEGIRLVPQVIFRDHEELSWLVAHIKELGATEIDINMGCPFPLQTARGRGAATIANPDAAEAVEKVVSENPDISFSVKMRLGYENPDEWRGLLPTLNRLPLTHITMHPRIARQQYVGSVDMEQWKAFIGESTNPVVYNGDLLTPGDLAGIAERYPGIAGIMIGRGILGRPSLFSEYLEGGEWPRRQRIEQMMALHRRLLTHYTETLCGDSQIISKIAPFWEYSEAEIGRKAWKAIKKASNMAKYHSAVTMIEA